VVVNSSQLNIRTVMDIGLGECVKQVNPDVRVDEGVLEQKIVSMATS